MTALSEPALGRQVSNGRGIVPDLPGAERSDYGEVVLIEQLHDSLLPRLISGEARVKGVEMLTEVAEIGRASCRERV